MSMRVILLGKNGQLGKEFENYLGKVNDIELFSFSHSELDITDLERVKTVFQDINPKVVINCAAYTKVDLAEKEVATAYKVNSVGAKNVSYASYLVNANVVYFSTDYVFDGNKERPYTEFDNPNPLSVYSKSKLFGEIYTREHNPNHLILRISWLYSIYGSNFVKTVIRLAKEKGELRIVNDQFGSPTYALDVVRQTWKLIQADRIGLYHSANVGQATWFEFAKEIIENLNLNVKVISIKTEQYPAKAKRPLHSVLENYLLKLENINIMRTWKVALKDFINNYKERLLSE
jgi:dTDP-4-dehydrorhamnose reductase